MDLLEKIYEGELNLKENVEFEKIKIDLQDEFYTQVKSNFFDTLTENNNQILKVLMFS